ncbi:hypothetical protein GCM10009579_04370 [Streptomyces javensis]|uniref:Uncharacterized protein n=1 Tax=Streptomyces javensis TaxID=114698 RepID=A0ABN1WKB6_9ACTN
MHTAIKGYARSLRWMPDSSTSSPYTTEAKPFGPNQAAASFPPREAGTDQRAQQRRRADHHYGRHHDRVTAHRQIPKARQESGETTRAPRPPGTTSSSPAPSESG